MKTSSSYVVGLMSGTSIDGIDAAVVKISDQRKGIAMELVNFLTIPYPNEVKEIVQTLCQPDLARIEDISMMNMLLGELFAEAALKVIDTSGLTQKDILLISSHGQTIYHQPSPIQVAGREISSTMQIGEIDVIAERTGIVTIGDFRTREIAAGGEGAPLVPYGDYLLFKSKKLGRVLVNIGGISNLTVLHKNCKKSDVIAYDTGPGNMIIDAFTNWATDGDQSYDKYGEIAATGNIHQKWLESLLRHHYYQLPSPKSTGREMFGIEYAREIWSEGSHVSDVDKITTVTALTAKTIAMEIEKHIKSGQIKEVLVSGGGRYNQTLMKFLSSYLPPNLNIIPTDHFGIPADAKEAMIFGLLGYECYHQRTNNLPSATGAKEQVIMGKIAWGHR